MANMTAEPYRVGDTRITRLAEIALDKLIPETLYPGWDPTALDDDCKRWLVFGRPEDQRNR